MTSKYPNVKQILKARGTAVKYNLFLTVFPFLWQLTRSIWTQENLCDKQC